MTDYTELCRMADAASHDERLSTGMLYRCLATAIREQADEIERTRWTAEYWKAEHTAANDEIARLRGLLLKAGEQIAADCLHSNCPHQNGRVGVECSCARSALLMALSSQPSGGEK